MSELSEQIALLEWCSTRQAVLPELAYLFAVPNGGLRAKKTAADLKRSGVRAGVPDLILLTPGHNYHGLVLEMKYGKNKVTPEQARWLEWLGQQGYYTKVCDSWQTAAETLEWYLDMPLDLRTKFFT